MQRRRFLGTLAWAASASKAAEGPEKKSSAEALDLQRKIDDTLAGRRPYEPLAYPYVSPDYKLPFTHIGTEKQLLLDNFMLEYLDRVERVLAVPEKHPRPLIRNTNLTWEHQFGASVVAALYDPDDRRFKMWYSQSLSGDLYSSGQVLCYAESGDGLNWEKPLSERCLPYRQHKATNIVHADDVSGPGLALNHDRSDPNRKFLLAYEPVLEARKQGLRVLSRVAASADGLRFEIIARDTPQRRRHGAILWDESIRQWVSYSQHSPHWHFGPRMRQIGRQVSSDFVRWSPKEVVLSTDWDPTLGPDREFHDASVIKQGGLYIALVAEAHTDPIWSSRTKSVRGMYEGTIWRDQFHVNLALYVSRDGRRFTRAHGPQPWVDNGPPGSPDHGFVAGTAGAALCHGGRMVIPYAAIPTQQWALPREDWELVPESARKEQERAVAEAKRFGTYGEKAGRMERTTGGLILREDGWAALRPTAGHGSVLTKQFVFEGDQLHVNADCNFGDIRVELLDPLFRAYEGFSAEDSDPIHNEDRSAVWHTVKWKGQPDVRALWNKPVMARFHLREASLYAFRFVDTQRN